MCLWRYLRCLEDGPQPVPMDQLEPFWRSIFKRPSRPDSRQHSPYWTRSVEPCRPDYHLQGYSSKFFWVVTLNWQMDSERQPTSLGGPGLVAMSTKIVMLTRGIWPGTTNEVNPCFDQLLTAKREMKQSVEFCCRTRIPGRPKIVFKHKSLWQRRLWRNSVLPKVEAPFDDTVEEVQVWFAT